MDHFHEEVVVKRNKGSQNVIYIISSITMIVAAFYSLFSIQMLIALIARTGFAVNYIFDIVFLLLSLASAIVLYLFRDRVKTEYEYTFTNGILDFAQVFNNKKRKNLGTMNVKNVEAFGMVSQGGFKRYSSTQNVKMTNWFLNRENELYYFYIVKDNVKRIIVFEPSEELVSLIKKYLPHGKYQVN